MKARIFLNGEGISSYTIRARNVIVECCLGGAAGGGYSQVIPMEEVCVKYWLLKNHDSRHWYDLKWKIMCLPKNEREIILKTTKG